MAFTVTPKTLSIEVAPKFLAQIISPPLLYLAPKTSNEPFEMSEASSRPSELVRVAVEDTEPPIKTSPTELLTKLGVTTVVSDDELTVRNQTKSPLLSNFTIAQRN